MKNVLLLVHDDAGEEARFQAALDLTRSISGHLTCLDVVQIPQVAGAEFVQAEAMLIAEAREREAANATRIKKRLEIEDVAWSWSDRTGDFSQLIEEAANLADIIVLNTKLAEWMSPDMRAIVSHTVLRSGKPILAVPASAHGLDTAGHALVAWNGSPPAAEALRAATPLLVQASDVTIVELGETSGDPAEEAASYLSRHGVHARVEALSSNDQDVAETLLTILAQRRPAYCVMGAYGHSRMRESLFGGVTRRMLTDSPVPLLIGH